MPCLDSKFSMYTIKKALCKYVLTKGLIPVRPTRFELVAHSLEGCCSIQLSYGRILWGRKNTKSFVLCKLFGRQIIIYKTKQPNCLQFGCRRISFAFAGKIGLTINDERKLYSFGCSIGYDSVASVCEGRGINCFGIAARSAKL